MLKSIVVSPRSRVTCRCLSPADIEKARNSLRARYYSVPREVTFQEVEMILKPLFQEISMDVIVIGRKVNITVANKPLPIKDFDTNFAIIDLINEWSMHDRFRKFMIKSMTNANKNNIHRYQPGMVWKCPMDVYYVFEPTDISDIAI